MPALSAARHRPSAGAGAADGSSTKGIAGFVNYPISMVTPLSSGGFISLDTVGPLSGKTFTATWDRSGSTVPITLGPAG